MVSLKWVLSKSQLKNTAWLICGGLQSIAVRSYRAVAACSAACWWDKRWRVRGVGEHLNVRAKSLSHWPITQPWNMMATGVRVCSHTVVRGFLSRHDSKASHHLNAATCATTKTYTSTSHRCSDVSTSSAHHHHNEAYEFRAPTTLRSKNPPIWWNRLSQVQWGCSGRSFRLFSASH